MTWYFPHMPSMVLKPDSKWQRRIHSHRFQVLMVMTVFWDVAPCSLIEIDLRFRDAYCLNAMITIVDLIMEAVNTFKTTSQYTGIFLIKSVR